jgi:hypothetical protein
MGNRSPAQPPAYLARLLELARHVPSGTVAHMRVEHDDGCAVLAGRGVCDCVPIISPVSRTAP